MSKHIYKLSEAEKAVIEQILTHGERVELIPCKENVKIIKVIRNEVKKENGDTAAKR